MISVLCPWSSLLYGLQMSIAKHFNADVIKSEFGNIKKVEF